MADSVEERLAKLEVLVPLLTEQVEKLTAQLAQFNTDMAMAKGGMKMTFWFLGAFGGVVALLTSFLTKKFG